MAAGDDNGDNWSDDADQSNNLQENYQRRTTPIECCWPLEKTTPVQSLFLSTPSSQPSENFHPLVKDQWHFSFHRILFTIQSQRYCDFQCLCFNDTQKVRNWRELIEIHDFTANFIVKIQIFPVNISWPSSVEMSPSFGSVHAFLINFHQCRHACSTFAWN